MDDKAKRKRAELNSVLFDFDSLMDIKVGAVLLMQNLVTSNQISNKYFKLNYLLEDRVFFKGVHQSEQGDLFSKIFIPSMKADDIKSIYNDLIAKYHDSKLITTSPLTNMVKLVQAYSKSADGAIKQAILCKSQAEKQYIETKFPGIKIVMCESRDSIEQETLDYYGSIIVGDIDDVDKFKEISAKVIIVLGYADNFETVKVGKSETPMSVLKPSIILKYGDVNEFEVADPYEKKFVMG